MAGYMMLVSQVTDWLRSNDVMFQTRGSAAGSLVCWTLGISNVDPIKWNLRFERFLSKDRTKPPDVDLDVAHDRRDELIAMLNTTVHRASDRIVGHLLPQRVCGPGGGDPAGVPAGEVLLGFGEEG